MRIIGNDPSVPRQTQEVASGTLPNGKPVVVNADGTVAAVANVAASASAGTPVVFEAANVANSQTIAYDSSNDKIVIAYRDAGDSSKGKAIVGTVSGSSISFGTAVEFESGTTPYLRATFDSSNNKVVIAYTDQDDNSYGKAIVGTVSGTSISFGSAVTFESASVGDIPGICFDSTNNKVVIGYRDGGNSNYGTAIVGTVSGTSISFGSPTVFESANSRKIVNAFDSVNGKVVIAYRDYGNSSAGTAIVGTVSGTSISFGSAVVFNDAVDGIGLNYDVQSGKVVVSFQDDGGFAHGIARVGTISGTSISFGTEVTYNAASTIAPDHVYDPTTQKTIIAYRDSAGGSYGEFVEGTVSGTDISFSSPTNFSGTNAVREVTMAYHTTAKKVVIAYDDNDNSDYGTAVVVTPSGNYPNLTSENYIGMSGGPITINSRTQAVGTAVQYESGDATQSNIVFDSTNNKIVITYRDSNNSNYATAIVGTVNASDNSISFGTPAVYSSTSTAENKPTFDSNAGKVVIAYYDGGNSNYGTAVVGTVSGTSISFGTPVVYNSGNATVSNGITFDSNSNRVVISYKDQAQSNHGKAIVGSVSGTSISFGTEVTFRSQRVDDTSMTFDSTNNKIVIAWSDDFHNDAGGGGGYGRAIVGTVDPSDNSITFGSNVAFTAHRVAAPQIGFDPVAGKVVIAHEENGTALRAIVGTVSGTSISFGTAVQYSTATDQTLTNNAVAFDSSAGKIAIAFKDETNSVGKLIAGTVSGTSITFDDETTLFNTSVQYVAAAYDSNSERLVVQVRDTGPDGKAIVVALGFTNITRGQVADGGHVLIDTQGAISDNQSGLTAGQSYFVQNDGTIGTTAADPSVFAGTAVSATKLIVKG